jgi:FO synthase subunit 1
MRILTYSRNVFIPVTNLCSNRCGYCSFRRDPKEARIIKRSEAMELISQGAKAGCAEALFSMGDSPWSVSGFEKLMDGSVESGRFQSDFIDYIIELCELALEHGLLPHTNAGILSEDEVKRLAPYNASMGLMLETTAKVAAHRLSPKKEPQERLSYIAKAGKLKIPFTTGILLGIGESLSDRIASLEAIASLQREYGHIQEVIIQPLDPKMGTSLETFKKPSLSEVEDIVRIARMILPESVAIQVPPNLIEPRLLVQAGANDLGGISPVTPDWINPKSAWPNPEDINIEGYGLVERLAVYPKYIFESWYGNKTEKIVKSLAGPDGLRIRNRELKVNHYGKEAS